MKIFIGYPPLGTSKGIPLLSQNRQFQYFKKPTYIYPVVPASAATLLKQAGYEVIWKDCIAEGWTKEQFYQFIAKEKPDVVAFETKTPVVQEHWQIINSLKSQISNLKCVLFGDHVTALSEESFQNSQVDYVLTGGDYDFLLLNLCNILNESKISTINYQLSTKLEPGIYYRGDGQVRNTGKFQLNHDLDNVPFIDRDLTKWQNYAYENGNYKRVPGTYIMSGRDCWWGKCSFCSWPTLYNKFRSRSVNNVLDEIGELIDKCAVKEIMDDSGTFPAGEWLRDFCEGMIERGYSRKVNLDCNMRFGALSADEYRLMKRAGFRLLLFGIESANQNTLNRINKNVQVENIIESCKTARKCGLYPHITIMFGYPWETYPEALNTLKLGKYLLRKGYAYTVQSTVVIPYPGSPLFEECKTNGWLKTLDWQEYDMKQPVMTNPIGDEKIMRLVRSLYGIAFNPEFIYNRLRSISSLADANYFLRAIPRVFGHIFDFRHRSKHPRGAVFTAPRG
ncbi:MAG: radical SAM protein [Candidatus Omnitrophota bacterium]|nr:radical SAM protein [Candidatus Omnitrophota bacterium]